MGTSTSILATDPMAADFARAGAAQSVLRKRARQRRHIQLLIAISYFVDCLLLLIYVRAGTIPPHIVGWYFAAGLAGLVIFTVMSEAGFNDRFADHYLVVPQSTASLLIAVVFAWLAPEVSIVFICTLFIIFSFSALRASTMQTAVMWSTASAALAILFIQTDSAFAVPHGSYLERLASLLVVVLSLGRCMFVGIYSSQLRDAFYQSGLKLKEAYRRIEELAEVDELTGCYNRRCIMRVLSEQVARSHRIDTPCSVVLIDLDWFKRINDVYGHPTGDEVLRTFAISVFANIRQVDKFGRYGGEEFLLVLPDTDGATTLQIMERIRGIVADLDWSAISPNMKVTISAGVATLRADENPDGILARADSALYQAKEQGRNRIVAARTADAARKRGLAEA